MNKAYQKMLVFVLIMGTTAGGLLVGADLLTRSQIEQNQINLKQRTILQSHDYDLSSVTDLATYYEDKIEVIESLAEYKDQAIFIYRDRESEDVTIAFDKRFGAGVWGPIVGYLTLESDLVTIKSVAIISQKETPGLGAKVTTAVFLNSLVGKLMEPRLVIDKVQADNIDDLNYVTSIVGATRTSVAFQNLLNSTYAFHQPLLEVL
jgi:Na+-transporting NADH:ubiquinone oxidoreductase subunit C